MSQFRVLDRLKAIKKTRSGLIGSFNIKKNPNLFESSFLIKLFYIFFAFLSHLETSHFSYRGSISDKSPYSQKKSNEQKIVFKDLLMFFLNSTLSFRNFK